MMTIAPGYSVANHNPFIVKYDQNGTVEALSVMSGAAADYLQVMVRWMTTKSSWRVNHYSSTFTAGDFSVFNSAVRMLGMRFSIIHHGNTRACGTQRPMATRFSTQLS